MSSIITQNRNRAHAVKQLQRGLKKASHTEEHIEDGVGDVQLLGSIANSLIYIGDILNDIRNDMKPKVNFIEATSNDPEMKSLFDKTVSDHDGPYDDDIPF